MNTIVTISKLSKSFESELWLRKISTAGVMGASEVVATDEDRKHTEQNVAVAVEGKPLTTGGMEKLAVERSNPSRDTSSVALPNGIRSSKPTFESAD